MVNVPYIIPIFHGESPYFMLDIPIIIPIFDGLSWLILPYFTLVSGIHSSSAPSSSFSWATAGIPVPRSASPAIFSAIEAGQVDMTLKQVKHGETRCVSPGKCQLSWSEMGGKWMKKIGGLTKEKWWVLRGFTTKNVKKMVVAKEQWKWAYVKVVDASKLWSFWYGSCRSTGVPYGMAYIGASDFRSNENSIGCCKKKITQKSRVPALNCQVTALKKCRKAILDHHLFI